MLKVLKQIIPRRTPRIATAGEFADFLSRHAAFIAQKCADDYCRGKTNLGYFALSEEDAFRQAMNVCRWEGYAAMLAAVSAVAQRFLLDAGSSPERLEPALVGLIARDLGSRPLPPHRAHGWSDVVEAIPAKLRAARESPDQKLAEFVVPAAKRLFETLPIHSNHRELDEEIVINSVQFQFVAFSDRFRREVDSAAVGRALAEPA